MLQFKLTAPDNAVACRQVKIGVRQSLRLRYKRPDVTAPHIGLDSDKALAILSRDLARTNHGLDSGHAFQRDTCAGRRFQHQTADGFGCIAALFMKPHDDRELPNAFKQSAGFCAADRGPQGVKRVLNIETIPPEGRAIDTHHELWRPCNLVSLNFSCPIDLLQDGL